MTIPLVNVGAFLDPALASARPELETSVASASHPIALLPVRLETRFFARDGGTSELRIRVYPDKVHLDSHDPSLSAGELDAGRAFWEQRWRAAADVARQQAAWAVLSDSFDPGRAAYIARALTPTEPRRSPRGAARRRGRVPHAATVSGPRRACHRPAHPGGAWPSRALGGHGLPQRDGGRRRGRP